MNADGTSDNNLENFYGEHSGTPEEPKVYRFDVLDASGRDALGRPYTAAAKFTNTAHDIHLYVKRGVGGLENWLDANDRCRRIKVFCDDLEAPGKYAFTVKGGCQDVSLTARLTGKQPKVCHVNGGDWSDQCKDVTEIIKLMLTCSGPQPVTWRSFNARGWLLEGPGPYKCKFQVPFGTPGREAFMFGWDIAKRLNLPWV